MKKLLFFCVFFICNIVYATNAQESNPIIQHMNLDQNLTTDCIKCTNSSESIPSQYSIILMPFLFNKQQVLVPAQLESITKNIIYAQLARLANNLYILNESNQTINFKLAESSLIIWQTTPLFLTMLQATNLHESINIPNKYFNSKSPTSIPKFMLIGNLKNLSFSEYIDNIPYTNLVSILHDFSLEASFYLIKLPQGVLVNKFTATGHSGTSKLMLNNVTSKDENWYSITLINEAFNNLIKDINLNLMSTYLATEHRNGEINSIVKEESNNYDPTQLSE